MSAGLLIDQNLPFGVVKVFKKMDVYAVHVTSINLAGKQDRDIWRYAVANDLVVVTKDIDFTHIQGLSLISPVRVVHLKIGNVTNKTFYPWIEANWQRAQSQLDEGLAVVALE